MIKTSFIKYVFVSVLIAGVIFAGVSTAQNVGIAAVVNNSAISTLDIQERMKLAIFSSNLPRNQGFEEKLLPQILRDVIDEKLYMKEAENINIHATEREIERVLADIEKGNGIQPGKLGEFLASHGVSIDAMREQITSQLTWSKIIAKKIRPRIKVTEKEIEEKTEYLLNKASEKEVHLSEILLTVDNDKDNKKVKEVADKLVAELRQDGNFEKIAKEFSKSSTAEKGGDMGWIRMEQLDKKISSVVKIMSISQISSPIRVDEGYKILRLREKRNAPSKAEMKTYKELKEKVKARLLMKKLELKTNQYLRRLRRGAFIEVRL